MGSTNSSSCVPCGPGSYSASGAACLPCPVGRFSAAAEASACTQCPAGSYSPAGSSACSVCTPGSLGVIACRGAAAWRCRIQLRHGITACRSSCEVTYAVLSFTRASAQCCIIPVSFKCSESSNSHAPSRANCTLCLFVCLFVLLLHSTR